MVRNRARIARLAVPSVCAVLLAAHAAWAGEEDAGSRQKIGTLYVAPDGNEAWSGTLANANGEKNDGPLATLEGARNAIRALRKDGRLSDKGVTVELRAGTYELARPFELTREDSGAADAPIRYRARKGDEVRISGGRVVTGFAPVTDPAVLARMDEGARGQVLQADLRAQGVTDLGEVKPAPNWTTCEAGLEVFFQDQPMTLARWPNEGFAKIVDVVGGAPHRIHGILGDKLGIFVYEGDRPKRWVNEKNVILDGYWFWDWANQRLRIESVDTGKRIITLAPPLHAYGYRKGQWYFALNLLPELDTPGEWYLDRDSGVLYFWPPAPLAQGKVMVSVLPTLVNLKDASHVTLAGLILEGARGTAVNISQGTQVNLEGCTIRNDGSWAVAVSGGTQHAVIGCDIYATGDGGISLTGGDRKTLAPAEHLADNNHIHHYSRIGRIYKPAIMMNGVGIRASHNLIHDAPHMAMGFRGNEHVIEYNEIHSVCYESNDAGAIYTGRDWTFRGNVLRYNYMHHLCGFQGRGCNGIYLDDQMSSALIYGNLFYKTIRPAFIGGGRDSTIENNVFVDCDPALHIDARGLGWAKGGLDGLVRSLKNMPYQSEPWASRYPQLVHILDEEPMAPRNNRVLRNICWGGKWDTSIEGKAKPGVILQDNLVQVDPLFEDAAHGKFRLRDDSPALKLGFKPLPLEKIGLYEDPRRASWPVQHTVRPMETPPAPAPAAAKSGKGGRPVFRIQRAENGAIPATAWTGRPGEGPSSQQGQVLVLMQDPLRQLIAPRSQALLASDAQCLYVRILNEVAAQPPPNKGNTWGEDDAVEVALRNPAAGKDAPIFVLRGYTNGHWESSGEAGAPAAAVKRAGEGVAYAAKVLDGEHWTAEWKIPFAGLGLDPAKHTKLEFNLTVRKTAGDQWLMWQGTEGRSWEVDKAGFLELPP